MISPVARRDEPNHRNDTLLPNAPTSADFGVQESFSAVFACCTAGASSARCQVPELALDLFQWSR